LRILPPLLSTASPFSIFFRELIHLTYLNTPLQVGWGYFGVYEAASLQRVAWHRRTTGGIEVVKYSPNGRQVATGSHESVIDLFDVKNKASPYYHRKRLLGHSSTVVHLDWSCDSRVIQSNCQAFEILYWDAIKGTNLRNTKDSTESDTVRCCVVLLTFFSPTNYFHLLINYSDILSAPFPFVCDIIRCGQRGRAGWAFL